MSRARLILAALAALALSAPAAAQEFRRLGEIPTPDQAARAPDGAEVISDPSTPPVDPATVRGAVETLFERWNAGEIEPLFVEYYDDRERLDETIISNFPRDAELRLLSVSAPETLVQYRMDGQHFAKVAVEVRSQIEFNDEASALQRIPGVSRLIFVFEKPADGAG